MKFGKDYSLNYLSKTHQHSLVCHYCFISLLFSQQVIYSVFLSIKFPHLNQRRYSIWLHSVHSVSCWVLSVCLRLTAECWYFNSCKSSIGSSNLSFYWTANVRSTTEMMTLGKHLRWKYDNVLIIIHHMDLEVCLKSNVEQKHHIRLLGY